MNSLLNTARPPVFCPGCGHEKVVGALDRTLASLGLSGEEVVMVTDIGCSGLFDTFFDTHAFHGLHGRALTYATGIKMARPQTTVIVIMGDGGLGIGGAHLLSTCRKNIDLTLLVLNNFNYGMTGGQCSSTTPPGASVGSGFLNRIEAPVEVSRLTAAAGATWTAAASVYDDNISATLAGAIRHKGFSVVDLHGICPGRYTRKNRLTPTMVAEGVTRQQVANGAVAGNQREEYGRQYRREAAARPAPSPPAGMEVRFAAPAAERLEILLLGSAGQRIVTAGELLCLAGMSAGMEATQKNDYPITVLRGHSVSELILSRLPIGFTGITSPSIVLALAPEGVARRKETIGILEPSALVVKGADIELPQTGSRVVAVDFSALKIKRSERALAALALLANTDAGFSGEMLRCALAYRFKGGRSQWISSCPKSTRCCRRPYASYEAKKIAPNADEWDANTTCPTRRPSCPWANWAFSAR
jgi:2-oxoglutarate ferredoxin oxidoreductase subunit beta